MGRATRDQLVRAAMEAFSDRGFRGASLDKIAAAIGVTKQALLYHFPSKNASSCSQSSSSTSATTRNGSNPSARAPTPPSGRC